MLSNCLCTLVSKVKTRVSHMVSSSHPSLSIGLTLLESTKLHHSTRQTIKTETSLPIVFATVCPTIHGVFFNAWSILA